MTSVYNGPGRTLPESTTGTAPKFVQEAVDGSVAFVTPAQVLAALAEIDAASAAAQGFALLPSSITVSTAAKPGGTYFISAAAAATVTLPLAAAAVTIAGSANRRVTVVNTGAAVTIWTKPAAGSVNGAANDALAPNVFATGEYDTDGTNWYKV